jgi:hypothetical protein
VWVGFSCIFFFFYFARLHTGGAVCTYVVASVRYDAFVESHHGTLGIASQEVGFLYDITKVVMIYPEW